MSLTLILRQDILEPSSPIVSHVGIYLFLKKYAYSVSLAALHAARQSNMYHGRVNRNDVCLQSSL